MKTVFSPINYGNFNLISMILCFERNFFNFILFQLLKIEFKKFFSSNNFIIILGKNKKNYQIMNKYF